MTIQATSVNLPDSAGDTITGTTTDAYAAALTWTCWGFSNKTVTISNTGDTNSLTWKIGLYSYPDGIEHLFEYDGETEFDLAAAGVDLTLLTAGYAKAIIYLKSTAASNATTYQLDYNGNLGGASTVEVTGAEVDVTAIKAKTDLMNSAVGTGTLNDANPSDTLVPTALPTKMHLAIDISNLNHNLDDFDISVSAGTAGNERVVVWYNLTSDGTDITADTGSGVDTIIKQRRLDFSDIFVYTAEQVIVSLTRNSGTDRNVDYKYLCGV